MLNSLVGPIHHFFKPAVEATSAAVDCDSRYAMIAPVQGQIPPVHRHAPTYNVVENTLDKHHYDGGGVAGANLGGVAGDNLGGVAGDNEKPRLLVSDKPNQPDPQVIPSQKTKAQKRRSTQSQKLLNHVVVCHVHKDELDSVNSLKLMAEFAGKSPQRRSIFGKV